MARWDYRPGLDLRVCITWGLCPGHVQTVDALLGVSGIKGAECLGGILYVQDTCAVA